MKELHINPTNISPEIHFQPSENIFFIRGNSSPEDVRGLYYPVIEWIKEFIDSLISTGDGLKIYTVEAPLRFQTDLCYFNSSSAKFLYDIFTELQRLIPAGIPFIVEWFYDKEDVDLREAGVDIASMAGMEFTYIPK
jgi:hypothetical protein